MIVENLRKINGDHFRIGKNKRGYDFNLIKDIIKYDDYYIYKSSNKQRQVTVDEFFNFKNCGYIFFKKDLYRQILALCIPGVGASVAKKIADNILKYSMNAWLSKIAIKQQYFLVHLCQTSRKIY